MVYLIKKNNQTNKTIETDFILAHNLFARAEIPPADKVFFRTFKIMCRVIQLRLLIIGHKRLVCG